MSDEEISYYIEFLGNSIFPTDIIYKYTFFRTQQSVFAQKTWYQFAVELKQH